MQVFVVAAQFRSDVIKKRRRWQRAWRNRGRRDVAHNGLRSGTTTSGDRRNYVELAGMPAAAKPRPDRFLATATPATFHNRWLCIIGLM
jgi:hypothetical protein